MNAADLSILRFFPEFEWLVNFGFGALVVYAATEIYAAVGQTKPEFNLSMIWLLMTIAFCLQSLFSMVRLYFQVGTLKVKPLSNGCVSVYISFNPLNSVSNQRP